MNNYKENKSISGNQKRDLTSCNQNTYILGKLAEGLTFYPGADYPDSITTAIDGSLAVFYLEALSDIPQPIKSYFSELYPFSDKLLFQGVGNDQTTTIKDPSYNYSAITFQLDYWRNLLQGKLIRFKPKVILKKGKTPRLNLEIDGIEGDYNGYSRYIPIPVVHMDNQTFEEKLKTHSYIQLNGYPHFFEDPEYIICGEYIYSNFDHWIKNSNNNLMWKPESKVEQIIRIRKDNEDLKFDKYIGGGNKDIIFLDTAERLNINDIIHEIGSPIVKSIYTADNNETERKSNRISPNNTLIEAKHSNKYDSINKNEQTFLKNLEKTTLKLKLNYDPKDLINFHISIKTNPLTVVAGMSGTGKTQLARAYAKALGLNEEDKNLLFLPITPSYLEPADILGYLNPTTGLYIPSETGLVDILLEAEQNPESLYMVVFDEMNLSQVEHWFAPFLSLLELEPENRRLSLYGDGSTCHNSFKYKPSVLLGENIMFVGTVNLDETTKDFSDRLLDRINVVTLKKPSFKTMLETVNNRDIDCSTINFDYEDFKAWISDKPGIKAYTIDELEFFDTLHDIINSYDNQKGVSCRLVDRIGTYINNIPIGSEMSSSFLLTKNEAIDLGIKQRLLTKIKGSERQIGNLIGTRLSLSEIEKRGELASFLESDCAQAISSFEETLKEINRKSLELGVYGFTN